MLNAQEALARLRAGNQRFVDDAVTDALSSLADRRAELVDGQAPFAIVLGCSDARVPAEIIFGQGVGDLFVIRVAGNVVSPALVGSVEYAAEQFGTRLVVVLGHTGCGAVTATVDQLRAPADLRSPNLRAIVDRIRPCVQPLMSAGLADDRDGLIRHGVRANVIASADHLRTGSEVLEQLIANDGLVVVGAEYDLATGRVDFFDGLPDEQAPPGAG